MVSELSQVETGEVDGHDGCFAWSENGGDFKYERIEVVHEKFVSIPPTSTLLVVTLVDTLHEVFLSFIFKAGCFED